MVSNSATLPEKQLNIAKAHSDASKMILERWDGIRTYLDSSLEEEAFLSSVIMELNTVDNDVDKASICKSVANLATIGLMPGAALQLAYFCPRKTGGKTYLQVELMYQGLLSLAYDNGFLRDVHCDVVLQGEECERWTDEVGPRINHKLPNERDLTFDNVIGAYCVWHGRHGAYGVRWTGKKELTEFQSKAPNASPWKSAKGVIQMCEKTPLKRASKFWPKGKKLSLASSLEDALDSDMQQTSVYEQEKSSAIDLSQLD